MFARWGRRDPIALFEEHLVDDGVARQTLEEIERDVEAEIAEAEAEAITSRRDRMPRPESALEDVYASGEPATPGARRGMI
jgi:TPP-dependent pyruvate/acetoin dehydrogenase alpha subunit